MQLYWIKTSRLIKKLFPKFAWEIAGEGKTVYLTFDDGPTPEITPWVLGILKKHRIKATFFCIGDNIRKYPAIFKNIIEDGHSVGNHTFNHLKGWETKTDAYIQNVIGCENAMSENSGISETKTKLFRPPYGKIKKGQAKKLMESGYRIIMWDVLTADYDRNVKPEKCLENATRKTAAGSIIVFHDSIKAFPNLEYALPKAIGILKEKGFLFAAIR